MAVRARLVRALLTLCVVGMAAPAVAEAAKLPDGFRETVAFPGLTLPMDVDFSPDGRIFVAEKSGKIKVFSGMGDRTPALFADLSANVHDYWDRGLMSFVLHPSFPETPYVYVLYAADVSDPPWGDDCPDPPGGTDDGCVISGRLSRLEADGNTVTGAEQVLIEDWCQQFPSHSLGDLGFGPEGALYASGGDGASWIYADSGQTGNPCADPPSEGGAFRSQDLRTPSDPTGLNGTVIRIDPATGAAWPTNESFLDPDPNVRRIIAQGMRNPFRFEFRPGTDELWVGDVGWAGGDEVDRISSPTGVLNFGWPCYEGSARQTSYDDLDNPLCETLYEETDAVTRPLFSYAWDEPIVGADDGCAAVGSAITGLAFYQGDGYPGYDGTLFVSDFARNCIWAMLPGADGTPDPAARQMFATELASPVDLEIGPAGDLYYVDIYGGVVRRIRYAGSNQPPTAVVEAAPTAGGVPLTVLFDGTGSSDPDSADPLTYEWDFEDDGTVGSALEAPTHVYAERGTYTARLRIKDTLGETDEATIVIYVGTTPPEASIVEPSSTDTWHVGGTIHFGGSATDVDQGNVPPSSLSWRLLLHHCHAVDACHIHIVETRNGVAEGDFVAPDHEYPSYLELELTATDSDALTNTDSVRLDPETVNLTFATDPSGLDLIVGTLRSAAPFTRVFIVGSRNSVSAPSPQGEWVYSTWSDNPNRIHEIVAPASSRTYEATYVRATPPPPPPSPPPPPAGPPAPPPPQPQPTVRQVRCVVPAVVGRQLSPARTRLARAHCRLGRLTRVYSRVVAGRVVSQRPRSGARLPNGARVALVVSRGLKKR